MYFISISSSSSFLPISFTDLKASSKFVTSCGLFSVNPSKDAFTVCSSTPVPSVLSREYILKVSASLRNCFSHAGRIFTLSAMAREYSTVPIFFKVFCVTVNSGKNIKIIFAYLPQVTIPLFRAHCFYLKGNQEVRCL